MPTVSRSLLIMILHTESASSAGGKEICEGTSKIAGLRPPLITRIRHLGGSGRNGGREWKKGGGDTWLFRVVVLMFLKNYDDRMRYRQDTTGAAAPSWTRARAQRISEKFFVTFLPPLGQNSDSIAPCLCHSILLSQMPVFIIAHLHLRPEPCDAGFIHVP